MIEYDDSITFLLGREREREREREKKKPGITHLGPMSRGEVLGKSKAVNNIPDIYGGGTRTRHDFIVSRYALSVPVVYLVQSR